MYNINAQCKCSPHLLFIFLSYFILFINVDFNHFIFQLFFEIKGIKELRNTPNVFDALFSYVSRLSPLWVRHVLVNTSLSYCDSVLFLNGSLPGSLKMINIGLCDILYFSVVTRGQDWIRFGSDFMVRTGGDDDDIRNSCAMLGGKYERQVKDSVLNKQHGLHADFVCRFTDSKQGHERGFNSILY